MLNDGKYDWKILQMCQYSSSEWITAQWNYVLIGHKINSDSDWKSKCCSYEDRIESQFSVL